VYLFITDFKIHGTKRNYNYGIAQFSNLDISILDFKLSPCPECCMLSFG